MKAAAARHGVTLAQVLLPGYSLSRTDAMLIPGANQLASIAIGERYTRATAKLAER
jgi:hypothetical protein